MSAPNKSYDPVEVAALAPEEVERVTDEALAAIAAAADLDALKAAQLAHAGDRAPLALANAEIGALPPAARAEAGKRVGAARGAIRTALADRQAELEAERDTPGADRGGRRRHAAVGPAARAAPGTRSPPSPSGSSTSSSAWATRSPRAPRSRPSGSTSTRSTSRPTTPRARLQDTLFVAGPDGADAVRGGAAHPHLAGADPRHAQPAAAALRGLPGPVLRTDALDATHTPVFNQIECLAVDEGLTMADLRGTTTRSSTPCSARACAPGCGRTSSRSPSRPPRCPWSASSAAAPPSRPGRDPCRTCCSEGWIELGGCGMVNPRVLTACGIDPERYSGFAFGFGIERMLMFRHGVATCETSSRVTSASPFRSGWRSDARPAFLAAGVRRPARRSRPAATWPTRLTACGLEVETRRAASAQDITGVVVGEVLDDRGADRVQEADPLLPGRRRADGQRARTSSAARATSRSATRSRGAARRGAARRVPDRRAQDLRPHLRGHDLLGPRARHRRRPRRHHRAAAGRAAGADASSCCGPARRGAGHRRHRRPRLLPVGARHRPGAGHRLRPAAHATRRAGLPADADACRPTVYPASIADPAGCDRFAARRCAASTPARRRRSGCSDRLQKAGMRPRLADRRHHQLRDAGARPAAARLRPRPAHGPITVRRAAAGREADHPGRRRPRPSTPRTC